MSLRANRILRVLTILVCAGLLLSAGAAGQDLFGPVQNLVTAEAFVSHSGFHPGATGYLALRAEIAPDWHINSDRPRDKYLIPTIFDVHAPAGVEIEGVLYPEPYFEKLDFSEGEMSLFHGVATFGAIVSVAPETMPGTYPLTATLSYQGCNNLTCVEPASITLETAITVVPRTGTVEVVHTDIFSKPPFVDAEGRFAGAHGAAGTTGGRFGERGLFLTFVFVFIGGLALNLTPCIYPLIPVTISFFGGQSRGKTLHTFTLALVYVLGMSIMYSILGTIAAMTGGLFGAALQNPWVVAAIALVLCWFAASMFGLWEIRVPVFLSRRTGQAKRGYLGALFMGLTVGVVAAPCIGPFILGLLTYVGKTGNPVLGFFMFFTLAWGLGIPFIVLGTVSGSISRIPRSGDWMIWVRKIFGFVLVAIAFYFARHLIGERLSLAGYGLTALVGGLYLGWIGRGEKGGRAFALVRRLVGIAGIVAAIVILLLPGGPITPAREQPGIAWTDYTAELEAAAAVEGKPLVIDFTADWCVPCHELEHETFSDPRVIELAKQMVTLRVDLTLPDEREQQIKKRFNIFGVPTIILIDRAGREITDQRVTGFVGPEEFAERLEKLLGST